MLIMSNFKFIVDTIPSYKIEQLPERYKEALLKKTQLTLKEIDSVMKALKFSGYFRI